MPPRHYAAGGADEGEATPTSAATVTPSSALVVFIVLTGDDEHADEIDPEIIGPFTSRDELIEALPVWLLPLGEERSE
jgi:hypothetical protein